MANIVSLRLLTARTAVDAVRHKRADLLRRLFTDPSSVTTAARLRVGRRNVHALLPSAYRTLVADITRRVHRALRLPVHAGIGSVVDGLHAITSSRVGADLVL